jgi:putative toxin-antitoxin system antitoxin component (TIGR02293 family)
MDVPVQAGFGWLIPEVRNAQNILELNELADAGLRYDSVKQLENYLELTAQNLAKIAGISARTVSRWDPQTNIGTLPSKNLIKLDEVVRRGIEVFGSSESFKSWLEQPNVALGDRRPQELLLTPYGTEIIQDALDSLEFGGVM